jgi:hypothetical protein
MTAGGDALKIEKARIGSRIRGGRASGSMVMARSVRALRRVNRSMLFSCLKGLT